MLEVSAHSPAPKPVPVTTPPPCPLSHRHSWTPASPQQSTVAQSQPCRVHRTRCWFKSCCCCGSVVLALSPHHHWLREWMAETPCTLLSISQHDNNHICPLGHYDKSQLILSEDLACKWNLYSLMVGVIICKTASENFRGCIYWNWMCIPSIPKYTLWWIPKRNGCICPSNSRHMRVHSPKPKTAQILISYRMDESSMV